MGSTVAVGTLEVTSNTESASEMVKALTPEKENGKEPRIIADEGREVESKEDNPLHKAAAELGKKGGEAAAKAREKAAKAEKAEDKAETETEAKPKEAKAEPSDKDADKQGKPRHDPEARVRQATAQLAEERRARQALEERLARLERGEKPATEPAKPAEAAPADAKPKAEDFETYDEYVEALADYRAEKKLAEHQARAETQARQQKDHEELGSRIDKQRSRITAAREADPDFDTKLDQRLTDLVPTFRLPPGVGQGPDNCLADEIMASDQPAELLLYLSGNEAEVKRILELPNPREIARAIALIESHLEPGKLQVADEPPEPRKRETSSAPPPPRPVTPSAAPGSPDVTGELDFDEFARRSGARRR